MAGDAVTTALNAVQGMNTGAQQEPERSMFGSRELLDEVFERRFEREKETAPQPQPQPQDNTEVESLKTQVELLQRQLEVFGRHGEVTARNAERQANAMDYLARAQAANQSQPEPLPTIEVDDPEMAAALNALESRIIRQVNGGLQQLHQSQTAHARSLQERELESTLKKYERDPEFAKHFKADDWRKFAAPYINNGQHVDWDNEIRLGLEARQAPTLREENERLKKELEQYKKGVSREREQQRSNLGLVPRIGGRAGAGSSGVPVGEQIQREARAKGKRLSFQQFGAELMKRRSMA